MIHIKEISTGEIQINFDMADAYAFCVMLDWEHLIELVDALADFRQRKFGGMRELHQAEHDPEAPETLRLMQAPAPEEP